MSAGSIPGRDKPEAMESTLAKSRNRSRSGTRSRLID